MRFLPVIETQERGVFRCRSYTLPPMRIAGQDSSDHRGLASHAAFAEAVMAELEAIAPVERGWGIDFAGQPHQNAVLLDLGAWLTLFRRVRLASAVCG